MLHCALPLRTCIIPHGGAVNDVRALKDDFVAWAVTPLYREAPRLHAPCHAGPFTST